MKIKHTLVFNTLPVYDRTVRNISVVIRLNDSLVIAFQVVSDAARSVDDSTIRCPLVGVDQKKKQSTGWAARAPVQPIADSNRVIDSFILVNLRRGCVVCLSEHKYRSDSRLEEVSMLIGPSRVRNMW